MSSEFQILICCARRQLQQHDRQRLTELLSSPLNWDLLIALAARHGLSPLLCHHLEASFPSAVPDSVRRELHFAFQETARRNLALTAELLLILELLESQGFPALSFKGPLLGERAYGNLALRGAYDLDILVRPNDACQARDLLLGQGYRLVPALTKWQERLYLKSHNTFILVRDPEVYSVELHWRLFPRSFSLPMETDDLVNRSVAVPFSGRMILTMDPHDEILHLAFHGARHQWDRLEMLAAFTERLRRTELDWTSLIERADGLGGGRMLRLALHLASDVLEGGLPSHVQDNVRKDPAVPRLADDVRRVFWERDMIPRATRHDVQFTARCRERWGTRIRYLVETTCTPTPTDWQAIYLPAWASALYPLVRVGRVVAQETRNRPPHHDDDELSATGPRADH